jgi:hypothetical protein
VVKGRTGTTTIPGGCVVADKVAAGWHGGPFTHGRPGVGVSLCLDILPKAGSVKQFKGITVGLQMVLRLTCFTGKATSFQGFLK